MLGISRFVIGVFILLLMASCASIDKDMDGSSAVDEAGNYKYEAWRLVDSGDFEAINILLNEADVLMDSQAFNAAADKLERVLRIKPEYAPAWSRLSWLALQMDSPKRSIQMAKRSNSFAYSNPELQSLNWSFILTASKQLNDETTYNQARQKLDSLKVF